MTDYYKAQLEDAAQYQDFIADQLRKSDPCIIIQAYSSRRYQYDNGESACGIEIKHDKKYAETKRLYIETAEKSNGDIAEFTPSGIFRRDNTWLYLIGDYEVAFLFSKHQLQKIYASKESWKQRGIFETQAKDPNGKVTSKGFCYPAQKAIENGTVLRQFRFEK